MSNLSLAKYSGPWEQKHAVHLLNRTLFGYKYEELVASAVFGFDATIDALFTDLEMPSPPIHYTFDQDPNAPIGSTWILSKQPIPVIPGLNQNRKLSHRAWHFGLLNEGGLNIREKMVMFWHDHMPISAEGNARIEFQYLNLLRQHATGNVQQLIEEITIAPAMLKYLNGNENTKEAPNENYSRELLELFTVGRGLEQGNGDYTNYTEKDVLELAKSLTGWRFSNRDKELPRGFYTNNRHDTTEKQLSERLGNQTIANGGAEEYKMAIDAIFKSDEVARFICRKLHVWFIDAEITPEIESNIIEPMSRIMIDDRYEIKRALKTLISSVYFNDEAKHGCMISSPLDFVFKILNTVNVNLDIDLDAKYFFWNRAYNLSRDLEMVILDVPSVAGWKAYYQAPQHYKYWINSVTLFNRDDYISTMERGITISGQLYGIDYLKIITQFENPADPNELINQLVGYLFSAPISEEQFDYLKNEFLEDRAESRWINRYNNYINDPSDSNKTLVLRSLDKLFERLIRMPEFHLM